MDYHTGMICAYCKSEFTPKPWPATRGIYCQSLCNKRAYADRHREKIRERWTIYSQTHRDKVLKAKRKYNNSEKGRSAHGKYAEKNKKRISGDYLYKYHTDPYVKAVHIARSTSRKRLARIREKTCESCNGGKKIECHHKDGNPLNTAIENLQWLCNACHNDHHAEGVIDLK